jgi:hypothetical protein
MDNERSHWEIRGSLPPNPEDKNPYRKNVIAHVVSSTARRALDLFESKYPTATTHSIHKQGPIDYIDVQPNTQANRTNPQG